MATMLVVYFVMACWAAGTSIASGVVVPMLLIGGIYGRMVGCLLVDQFGIQVIDDDFFEYLTWRVTKLELYLQHNKYWAWMDPGAFALLGSVSFFAGVTRLTMSLTVIMVEITNDIHQVN
jgi:chloride channel 7